MSEEFKKAICNSIQANKDKIEKLTKQNERLKKQNKQLKEQIDKAIKYIKEYGRDKQLEEEYLMSAYNLAMYNITLLEILGEKENE